MQLSSIAAALLIAALSSPFITGCNKLAKATPEEHIQRAKDFQAKGDIKTSIIELKSALQAEPNNAQARLLLGELYIKDQQGSAAEKELRKAKELGVNEESIKASLGEALLLQGEYKKALNEIHATPESSQLNQARILRLHGDAMLGLGQLEEGCAQYKQSVAVDKSYVPAYWGLAKCAVAHRDLAEARSQIESALKEDQANPDTWVFLGEFEQYNKNLDAAEAAFSHALKIAPKNKNASLDRALIHLQQHKYDLAQADLVEIKKFAPEHPLTYFLQAAVQYGKGSYQASLDSLQQVFKYLPNFMPAVRLAGVVQYNLGSFQQSIKLLRQYLDLYPGDLQVRKLLAAAFMAQGQGDQALELLKPMLNEGKGDDYQLLALAGQAYLQSKDPTAAAQQFEKAAAIDPKNVGLHMQLGLSLVSAGKTTQGVAELETAAKLDSKHYKADFALVLTYLQQGQFDKALDALAELEKRLPNNPAVFDLRGGVYLGKNDLVNARKSFESALAADPASLIAAINMAQLDLHDKNTAAARKRFEGVFSKDKDNLLAMLYMADIAAVDGKDQEYLDWLGKAAKAHPTAVQPRARLARYYLGRNQPMKALNYAREAQSAQPDNPLALEIMGDVELALGDKASALVNFKRLAEVASDSAQSHYRLASLQAAMGNLAEARKALQRALHINPDFVDAQAALLGLEVRDGRYDAAQQIARQVQLRHPKSALGLVWEGDVLMAQKHYPQAIRAYESAWGLEKSGVLAIKLFQANNQAGARKEGEARILQWLKEKPDDKTARAYLAQIYMEAGQNQPAIEQYLMLLQGEPNNALALNNLAWLYHKMKDPRGLEYAERAYKLHPDAAFILDTLGSITMDKGNPARGLDLLKKAASLAPKNPEIKYHYAAALARTGDKATARKQLEELLSWPQPFAQRDEARALLKQL